MFLSSEMCCSCIPYPCRTTFGVKTVSFAVPTCYLYFLISASILLHLLLLLFSVVALFVSRLFSASFFSDTSCPFLCAFECCLFYVHVFLQKPFSIAIVGFFGSSTNYILIYTFFICATISFLSLSHSVLLLQGRSLISNILQITMPNSSNNI